MCVQWLYNAWYSSQARELACSNPGPRPGAKTFGGLEGEGGGGAVSRQGPREGGAVGTPTYTPQNVLHDALIIFNTHNWGKTYSHKKFAL